MSARVLSRMVFSQMALLVPLATGGVAYAQSAGPRITVETVPPGAKVYVDGKERGIACQSGPTCRPPMSRGTHRLQIELDGYRPVDETIRVSGPQRFAFTLQAAPARLDVKTLATNAAARDGEILVDGKLTGSVPAEVEVAPGKHMLEVRRPGFLPYSESIEVRGGETRPIFVALTAEAKSAPSSGTLMVTAEQTGAEVLVDDQPRGPAPVLVDSLPPGDHVVEIRPKESGFEPWRRNVRVTAGQQATAYATFVATPKPAPPPPPVAAPAPPPPPAIIVQAPPPPAPAAVPPRDPSLPVAFVPRSTEDTYVVTLPSGQSCATPCSLPVQPGGQVLSVSGPGAHLFREPIEIPTVPSQVTVQHFTAGRLAGGIVLVLLGVPAGVLGGLYLGDTSLLHRSLLPDNQQDITIVGGVLVGVGAALTLGGIISMAATKGNRAEVQALGPIRPQLARRVRVLPPTLFPTADGRGAFSSVLLTY